MARTHRQRRTLTAVTVNGWQQGWVLPAGTDGTVTLSFPSDTTYRAGLIGGLALLPLLLVLSFVPTRGSPEPGQGARPWQPAVAVRAAGLIVAVAVISGVWGIVVAGAAFGVRYLVRRRENLWYAMTVGIAAAGLVLAGAILSQNPWRSVDGYAGHSAGVQLLALLSVVAVAMSAVPPATRDPDAEDG